MVYVYVGINIVGELEMPEGYFPFNFAHDTLRGVTFGVALSFETCSANVNKLMKEDIVWGTSVFLFKEENVAARFTTALRAGIECALRLNIDDLTSRIGVLAGLFDGVQMESYEVFLMHAGEQLRQEMVSEEDPMYS